MSEGLAATADRSRPDALAPHVESPRRAQPRLVLQGAPRRHEAGSTIYAQSEPAEFIYQVASGVVRTITLRRDGRRTVHGFHLPGEIFGLEREKLHHCSAEAVCETRLMQWPVTQLNALAESDKDAARELWMSLLLSRDRTAERFMYIMHGTAFEKLAYFLIDLALRTRSDGQIDLPMSRYDIADYLGLSSETVSRTFSALRARGLIATNGRRVRLLSDEILHVGAALCDGAPVGEHGGGQGSEPAGEHWPRTLP